VSEWGRFNVPLDTLQVISETVLQAITCTGTNPHYIDRAWWVTIGVNGHFLCLRKLTTRPGFLPSGRCIFFNKMKHTPKMQYIKNTRQLIERKVVGCQLNHIIMDGFLVSEQRLWAFEQVHPPNPYLLPLPLPLILFQFHFLELFPLNPTWGWSAVSSSNSLWAKPQSPVARGSRFQDFLAWKCTWKQTWEKVNII